MDQEVIEIFNKRYKYKLFADFICKLEIEETRLLTAPKSINMDVIYVLAKAYEEMPQSTFIKS